jgi:hypothetical protein
MLPASVFIFVLPPSEDVSFPFLLQNTLVNSEEKPFMQKAERKENI